MAISLQPHPPADMAVAPSPSGPFTFRFSASPQTPNKSATSSADGIATELTMTSSLSPPSPSSSSSSSPVSGLLPNEEGEEKRPERISPIERLPSELHTLIAKHLPLPSVIINLAWTCRRLYASLGPTNRLLWYKILYQRLESLPWNLTCPLIPPFSQDENYYQRCLDIMCNRAPEKKACQRCLIANDGSTASGSSVVGTKKEEKWVQLVDIYVAKIYSGTWCWDCAKEVYELMAIVNLQTPLPYTPTTLHTTIISHPCGHPKPGFFVSRSAIAAAVKEQCRHGRYTPFNITQHAEPDIREAKPYVMKTVMSLYRKWYQHLHILFDPKELGRNIKTCFEITTFRMSDGVAYSRDAWVRDRINVQNELIDAVFGAAKTYLVSKEIEDEEKQEEERLDACRRFLLMFFGVPNTAGEERFKLPVPTTRFLTYIAKRYWVAKMEELGRYGVQEGGKFVYFIEEKPKKRCGICVTASDHGDQVTEVYSPIMLVFHMISEHPDEMEGGWPEVPDLPRVKKEQAAKKTLAEVMRQIKKDRMLLKAKEEKTVWEVGVVEDVRFLFGALGLSEDSDDELNNGIKDLVISETSVEVDSVVVE
ncbi:hypothetical protein TWF718_009323 [Orbilia javanica]|uniref:F-box domain-containing protein n=1 Tax=Orbilia javanica TaxID=47235 RepID=A0AAN8RGZ0_9PEZI